MHSRKKQNNYSATETMVHWSLYSDKNVLVTNICQLSCWFVNYLLIPFSLDIKCTVCHLLLLCPKCGAVLPSMGKYKLKIIKEIMAWGLFKQICFAIVLLLWIWAENSQTCSEHLHLLFPISFTQTQDNSISEFLWASGVSTEQFSHHYKFLSSSFVTDFQS